VRPGRAADRSPLLVPRSWKSRATPLPTLWATPGLKRDHFLKQFMFVFYYVAWLYKPFSIKINETNEKPCLVIKLCFRYNYCGHNVQYTLRNYIQMTPGSTNTSVCSMNEKERICGR